MQAARQSSKGDNILLFGLFGDILEEAESYSTLLC